MARYQPSRTVFFHLYEQRTTGATGLEGLISLLTVGAAQLITLRNGLPKKRKKKNVRYSLNEISQDVKPPAGLAALNQDRKGLH